MKVKLPLVTLAMIDRDNPDWSARVLNYCCRGIDFGAVRLWSYERPRALYHGAFHRIPKFDFAAQQEYTVRAWPHEIGTPFVLTVHKDGFVLNPRLWEELFLDYDYIGAPWPRSWGHVFQVGNGGFSLRSRKFLRAMQEHADRIVHPEDVFYCRTIRPELEKKGMRYAPVEIAARFSQEHPIEAVPFDDGKIFGYHGWTHDGRRRLAEEIRDGRWDEKASLLQKLRGRFPLRPAGRRH